MDPRIGELLLNQPEIAEELMRALGLKGDLPQALDPLFQVSVQAMDLSNPEWRYLRRNLRMHQGTSVGALAANFSTVVFCPQNTVVTRVLAVVERIIVSNSNAAAIAAMIALGVPANAVVQAANTGVNPSDDRFLPQAAGGVVPAFFPVTNQNAVGALSGFGGIVVDIPANSSVVIEGPFILSNKTPVNASAFAALMVGATAVNQAIRASFIWHERALLASEL